MSVSHIIVATLNEAFSKESVFQILKQGESLNLIYYVKPDREPSKITIEEALSRLFETNEALHDDGGPLVHVKYEDTYFGLWIRNFDGQFTVMVGSIGYPWKKEFWESDSIIDIDYARYIQLMLKLVKGFTIVSLKTDTSY